MIIVVRDLYRRRERHFQRMNSCRIRTWSQSSIVSFSVSRSCTFWLLGGMRVPCATGLAVMAGGIWNGSAGGGL